MQDYIRLLVNECEWAQFKSVNAYNEKDYNPPLVVKCAYLPTYNNTRNGNQQTLEQSTTLFITNEITPSMEDMFDGKEVKEIKPVYDIVKGHAIGWEIVI